MIARLLPILIFTVPSISATGIAQTPGAPKPEQYEMTDGAVLIVSHDTLTGADGRVVVDLAPDEVLSEVVQSANKKFVLCRLQVHRGPTKQNGNSKNSGYDFSGLARVSHGPAGWSVQRVWKVDHNEWVRDLGAISDDGTRALFRVARKSAPLAPYTVSQQWQTWDLEKNVLIKTGLNIE